MTEGSDVTAATKARIVAGKLVDLVSGVSRVDHSAVGIKCGMYKCIPIRL
jgi:hypothetical protein